MYMTQTLVEHEAKRVFAVFYLVLFIIAGGGSVQAQCPCTQTAGRYTGQYSVSANITGSTGSLPLYDFMFPYPSYTTNAHISQTDCSLSFFLQTYTPSFQDGSTPTVVSSTGTISGNQITFGNTGSIIP